MARTHPALAEIIRQLHMRLSTVRNYLRDGMKTTQG